MLFGVKGRVFGEQFERPVDRLVPSSSGSHGQSSFGLNSLPLSTLPDETLAPVSIASRIATTAIRALASEKQSKIP